MAFDRWQTPDRDSPTLIQNFSTEVELQSHLRLLLQMEGRDGHQPAEVREITGENISRPRRWHKFFERMGLMYKSDSGNTVLTDLGRLLDSVDEHAERMLRRSLARKATAVLRKYQLKNPADDPDGEYPAEADIHPYWAVWKAAVELDGRLHWDEVNRVLMWVLRHDQLQKAIGHIRNAREHEGYDPLRDGTPEYPLGERAWPASVTAPDGKTSEGQLRDQQFTPLFKRAGFAELILEKPGRGGEGYWTIPDDVLDIVREAVIDAPEYRAFSDEDDWFRYFGRLPGIEEEGQGMSGPMSTIASVPIRIDDRIKRMVRLAIASSPAVMLVGPPGSGKTTLLEEVLGEIRRDPPAHGFTAGWDAKWVTPEESWTARDLIGGDTVDEHANIVFRPGYVLEAIRNDQWLVLDEANRADMDRIFGGLMTWLSGHQVELGRATTAVDAPTITLEWNPGPRNICENVDNLKSGEGEGVRFRAGREWRLLGTYNAQDAQRVFRFGQALGRRFVRVPIPAMSVGDFRTTLDSRAKKLPSVVRDKVVKLYEAHYESRAARLGPALFFWIPDYVERGLTTEGIEEEDTGAVESLLAEAYLSVAGVWLAKLDDEDLRELEQAVTKAGGALSWEEWTWIMQLLPSLG